MPPVAAKSHWIAGTEAKFPGAGRSDAGDGRRQQIAMGIAGQGKVFHDERLPVFLLAVYGKSEKANLSKAEQNTMAKVVSTIVQSYPRGRGTK